MWRPCPWGVPRLMYWKRDRPVRSLLPFALSLVTCAHETTPAHVTNTRASVYEKSESGSSPAPNSSFARQ